jgi:hypothetical protein
MKFGLSIDPGRILAEHCLCGDWNNLADRSVPFNHGVRPSIGSKCAPRLPVEPIVNRLAHRGVSPHVIEVTRTTR